MSLGRRFWGWLLCRGRFLVVTFRVDFISCVDVRLAHILCLSKINSVSPVGCIFCFNFRIEALNITSLCDCCLLPCLSIQCGWSHTHNVYFPQWRQIYGSCVIARRLLLTSLVSPLDVLCVDLMWLEQLSCHRQLRLSAPS